jgi:ABC-type multidrug transport system ATPase subunit
LFGERLGAGVCPPQIAYVPAVPVYYPFLSERDVLELRLARNLFSPRRETLVDRTLSRLDLDSVARCRIGALPKDVLRSVALAEAFVGGPDVVLADTNASDLMPPLSPAALRALEQHAAEGCAVVVASRDVASLASVANRILLLDSGRIARTFSLESYGEPIIPDAFPPVGKRFVAERVH